MKILRVALPAVLALGLIGAPAFGHTVVKQDAQEGDTPLDIAEVKSSHGALKEDGSRNLRHTVTTYGAWADDDLKGGDNIWIDLKAGEWTGGIRIRSGNELKGDFYDGEQKAGSVKVTRPNEFSVRVVFSSAMLPEGTTSYKWSATTNSSTDCEEEECPVVTDRAPNAGRLTAQI